MHQEVHVCAESNMLATEFCTNIQAKGAVIIPIGHPLYDYIDEYRNTMSEYLGEFATLKLTTDDNYNQQLVQSVTCTLHSNYSWQDQPMWGGDEWGYEGGGDTWQGGGYENASYDEAQALVSTAYSLLTERGGEVNGEQYVAIIYAINQLEAILAGASSQSLAEAMGTLQYALMVFY